jgi:DNA-binding response OmpR family regulator
LNLRHHRPLLRLFEERDAVVITASSAAEGLAALRGRVHCRRKTGDGTPVIGLTAYARAEDRVRAVAAGFQPPLSKPVELVELIVVAASLVESR